MVKVNESPPGICAEYGYMLLIPENAAIFTEYASFFPEKGKEMLQKEIELYPESATRESQYAKMYEEKPITLLVMPPINNSTNAESKDLLYTSISRPLVEAVYYVISPLLAMDVLVNGILFCKYLIDSGL